MQNHLELHNLEHRQLVREANHERLVNELNRGHEQESPKPHSVKLKLGQLLVEVGEQLQESAYKQVHPAR